MLYNERKIFHKRTVTVTYYLRITYEHLLDLFNYFTQGYSLIVKLKKVVNKRNLTFILIKFEGLTRETERRETESERIEKERLNLTGFVFIQ